MRRRLRAAVYGLLAIGLLLFASRTIARGDIGTWWAAIQQAVIIKPAGPPTAEPESEAPDPALRADAKLRRERYSSLKGGVLVIPSTFESADGTYDLILHFHGDVKIVVESVETANLNAVLAIINLGVGSGPYEDDYKQPGAYEALLAQIQQVLESRGLKRGRLRRVALSSWSAGYGAISSILQMRRKTEQLDALMMLDGLHCGRLPDHPTEINFRQMAPFVEMARAAATGGILFTITHSDIDPRTYVSAKEASSYLIDAVRENGVEEIELKPPPHVKLKAAALAVEPKLEKWLEPTRDVRVGNLHVRGFTGETAEHHISHLTQMSATVLPELAERWSRDPH